MPRRCGSTTRPVVLAMALLGSLAGSLSACGGVSVSGPSAATVTVTVTATPSSPESSPGGAATSPGDASGSWGSPDPSGWPAPSGPWSSTSGAGAGSNTADPGDTAPGAPATRSRYAGELTPSGTTLEAGDPAVGKLVWQQRETALRVVPMRIERASAGENETLRAGPAQGRAGVGWFVTVDVTNVDEWVLEDVPLFLKVDAFDAEGRRFDRLRWDTSQGRCPSGVVRVEPQRTASSCSVFWVPETSSIEQLAFQWDYAGGQVRWRRTAPGSATSPA